MPVTHPLRKRIPLLSPLQIRHEIIVMWAEDELRKSEARQRNTDLSTSDPRAAGLIIELCLNRRFPLDSLCLYLQNREHPDGALPNGRRHQARSL
jgi:hypothetical protein